MNPIKHTTTRIAFLILCMSFLLFSSGKGQPPWLQVATSDSAEKFKKEEEITRIRMLQISRELGVTCTECHSSKNWKDDSKLTFKIARDHMKTVEILRNHDFDGKKYPEASCYMCHQGRLRFASQMKHPENLQKIENSKKE